MKKSFLMKLFVLLTLTVATVATAQINSNVNQQNTDNIQISSFGQVVAASRELDAIVKEISELNDQYGSIDDFGSTDDSPGYLKALGEKLDMTENLRVKFSSIASGIHNKSGQSLPEAYNEIGELLKEARKNLTEAKALFAQFKKSFEN